MFLVFTTYVVTGGELTPKKVFTALSLLITLRLTSIHFFIQNVLGISEGFVATTRISVSIIGRYLHILSLLVCRLLAEITVFADRHTESSLLCIESYLWPYYLQLSSTYYVSARYHKVVFVLTYVCGIAISEFLSFVERSPTFTSFCVP